MSNENLMAPFVQAQQRSQAANSKAAYQKNINVVLDSGSQTNAILCKFNKAEGNMNQESFDQMISTQKSQYNRKAGKNFFNESSTSINKRRRFDNNNKVSILSNTII